MKWNDYKVDVPCGQSGTVVVRRFTVSEADAAFHNLRASFNRRRGDRLIYAGEYTALYRNGTLWMSDTPAEIQDHYEPIRRAHGRCLVNGLGLGVVIRGMLLKSDVEHVTVIEIDSDVISLVGTHYQRQFGERLDIIQADSLRWKPPYGVRFGAVWHDIWSDKNPDNLPEMKLLHRRYGRRCDWQGSWSRDDIKLLQACGS